jgi:rubrerythrin
MVDFDSIEEILRFAVTKEEASHLFYTDMAENVDDEEVSNLFRMFAQEELRHKEMLELEIMKRGHIVPDSEAPSERTAADYTLEGEFAADYTRGDALKLAIQKEHAAFRMYVDLLRLAENEEAIEVFMTLAEEEIRHKVGFESAYNRYMKKT